MKVPFLKLREHNLSFKKKYQIAFEEFLNSGEYILGKKIKEFEDEFKKNNAVKYSLGVSNCLDGLELLLRSIRINPGDEVIVPSNTYIATWLAVLNVGAIPIPVEPNIDTFNIDPLKIESAITEKTKAIIVVHLYGLPCEMDEINQIAKKYSLYVFEDCAQSYGSKYKGRMSGCLSDGSAFSFYPSKNLGALGDAGMIATNNENIYEITKKMRNYGSTKKYINDEIGKNSRLDELQAYMLSIRLNTIDNENHIRTKLAKRYIERLSSSNIPIKLPSIGRSDTLSSCHLFVILSKKRDDLEKFLLSKEITTMKHYPIPPHKQKALLNSPWSNLDLPISEVIHDTCLSLPISCMHLNDEIDYVCDSIIEFFN